VILYRWARSAEEAADLQRDGWEPRPQCLETHHGQHALLHRKEQPEDSPCILPRGE
jgi:hypothetical protein